MCSDRIKFFEPSTIAIFCIDFAKPAQKDPAVPHFILDLLYWEMQMIKK